MCWSQQLLLSRPLSAATPSATWWTTTRFTGNAAIWRGRNLTRKPVEYHPADRSLTCLTLSSTPRRSQQVSVNVTTLCWYAWGRHKDPHHLACDLWRRVERLCFDDGVAYSNRKIYMSAHSFLRIAQSLLQSAKVLVGSCVSV